MPFCHAYCLYAYPLGLCTNIHINVRMRVYCLRLIYYLEKSSTYTGIVHYLIHSKYALNTF